MLNLIDITLLGAMNTETIGDRIKQERLALKLTQEELGRRVGITKSAINKIETGSTKSTTPTHLVRLARVFNVSTDWLAIGDGSRQRSGNNAMGYPVNIRLIPVVGRAEEMNEEKFKIIHQSEGDVATASRDPDAYAVRVVGDGLHPRIKNGEFVIVEPNREPQPGDEVEVRTVDGGWLIREYLYTREGHVYLASINTDHGRTVFESTEVKSMRYISAIARPSAFVKK